MLFKEDGLYQRKEGAESFPEKGARKRDEGARGGWKRPAQEREGARRVYQVERLGELVQDKGEGRPINCILHSFRRGVVQTRE